MPLTGHPRRTLVATLALAGAATLGACSVVAPSTAANAPGRAGTTGSANAGSTGTPAVVLTPSVTAGRSDVAVDTVVKVGARQGTVSEVKITYREAKTGATVPVQGTLDPSCDSRTA